MKYSIERLREAVSPDDVDVEGLFTPRSDDRLQDPRTPEEDRRAFIVNREVEPLEEDSVVWERELDEEIVFDVVGKQKRPLLVRNVVCEVPDDAVEETPLAEHETDQSDEEPASFDLEPEADVTHTLSQEIRIVQRERVTLDRFDWVKRLPSTRTIKEHETGPVECSCGEVFQKEDKEELREHCRAVYETPGHELAR